MLITLAKTKSYDIPGCEPFIIKRSDVTNKKAWYLLTVRNTPYLNVGDFYDFDVYTKYYLVTTGLLDYSMALIYGNEGGGKSLVMSFLTHKITNLFGKRCVLDWTPPHPEFFPNFYDFNDEEFSTKIQGEMKILEKVEREAKKHGMKLSPEAYRNLIIYNSIFALDEGDSYADKLNVTNLTKLIARIIRRRRHYHTCMFMVFVDPHDAPSRLIGGRASHEIECSKDLNRPGWCVYTILTTKTTANAKAGTKKLLHLNPKDCTDLWDSYNAVTISHDQDIYLGGKKHKKQEVENN